MNYTRQYLSDTDRVRREFRFDHETKEVVKISSGGTGSLKPCKSGKGKKYVYFGVRLEGRTVSVTAHRIAFVLKEGRDIYEGMNVDHINGDTADNSFENIREICPRGNNLNTTNRDIGASGYRGVCSTGRGYYARISLSDNGVYERPRGPTRECPAMAYLDRVNMAYQYGVQEDYQMEFDKFLHKALEYLLDDSPEDVE